MARGPGPGRQPAFFIGAKLPLVPVLLTTAMSRIRVIALAVQLARALIGP